MFNSLKIDTEGIIVRICLGKKRTATKERKYSEFLFVIHIIILRIYGFIWFSRANLDGRMLYDIFIVLAIVWLAVSIAYGPIALNIALNKSQKDKPGQRSTISKIKNDKIITDKEKNKNRKRNEICRLKMMNWLLQLTESSWLVSLLLLLLPSAVWCCHCWCCYWQ